MLSELEQAMDASRELLASEVTFKVTIEDGETMCLCANCLNNALYGCLVDAVEYQRDYTVPCAGCADNAGADNA